jgi:peptidoglycan hydrolase-like protein with peptidoglycan-binding domain
VPRVLRTVRSAVIAVVVALVVGATGAGVAQAAVPDPVAPVKPPALVEGLSPYLPQVSCDPVAKPGTLALRSMLLATYGGRDLGITRGCDIGATSEHKEGRAWDWGLNASVPAEKAVADQFLTWLLAPGPNGMPAYNARRLGVMYVIFNGRIWSSYRAGDGWRAYSGGESHADHIHISLSWSGAAKRTSWWSGKAVGPDYGPCPQVQGNPAPPWSGPRATPCPTPIDPMTLTGAPLLARDATGAYVVQLQRLLSVTPVTGFFGPITAAALTAFQKAHGLSMTGTTTPATWSALRGGGTASPPPAPTTQTVTAGRGLPATMRYSVRKGDSLSRIAATWGSSVGAIRSASRLTSDTIRVGQVVIVPVRSGITKFTWTWLQKGDQGVAVKALQTALRMKLQYRTGLFGDITKGAVNKLKAAHRWPVDGVAGPGVWRALGA